MPTPAPSSQIDQKDGDSSDSTQTESEIPVSSKVFGRYARPTNRSSDTVPFTPRSSKASAAYTLSPLIHQNKLKRSSSEVDIDVSENVSRPQEQTSSPSTNLRSSARLRNHSKQGAATRNEISKPKTDEGEPSFRNLRRKLSTSASPISFPAKNDSIKLPSKRNKTARILSKMPASPSSEGSSEDVVSPRQRRRPITEIAPDPLKIDSDSDSGVSQEQVADELQEDLKDIRDSGEYYAEYIVQFLLFHVYLFHSYHML